MQPMLYVDINPTQVSKEVRVSRGIQIMVLTVVTLTDGASLLKQVNSISTT